MDIDAELERLVAVAVDVGEHGLAGLLNAVRLTLHDSAWKSIFQKQTYALILARKVAIETKAIELQDQE